MWIPLTLVFFAVLLFFFGLFNHYRYFLSDVSPTVDNEFLITPLKKLFKTSDNANISLLRYSVMATTCLHFLNGYLIGIFVYRLSSLSMFSKTVIVSLTLANGFFLNYFMTRIFPLLAKKLWKVSYYICLPPIALFSLIDLYLSKFHDCRTYPRTKEENSLFQIRDQLVKTFTVADHNASVTSLNLNLTKSILHFKEVIVRETMIPKVDVFALSEDISIKAAVTAAVKEGYSRIPLYRKSIDAVTGTVLFKDLLRIYKECWDGVISPKILEQPVSTIAKPAFYTPELKQASLLLQELRQRQTHMAIVVNEYGTTEGVVTMEDLLEEIVGEILDEYDTMPRRPFKKIGHSWFVDGRMNISEAEEALNISIDTEGPYDTLAGHVFHKIGSSPKKGMKIHHDKFDIEILSCSERNIEQLKITPLQHETDSE
ncbi:MAG: hemolysin family protein [Victivallaceae bacterium]